MGLGWTRLVWRRLLMMCALMGLTLCLFGTLAHSGPRWLAPNATEGLHGKHPERLVWRDERAFSALLEALEGLAAHGLDPRHYHLEALERLRGEREGRDRLATDAWFAAAAHMVFGKLDPVSIEPTWTAAGRSVDLASVLLKALKEGTVGESLGALAPRQPVYGALVGVLAALRAGDKEAGDVIPAGGPLSKGMTGPRVSALQTRLAQLSLYDGAVTGLFDDTTCEAVWTLQDTADLDADGVAGPATLRVLNRGSRERIDQLRVNMERLRWLPEDLGRRHVRVNIAGFDVSVFDQGQKVRAHLAIVGKHYRQTPVFSDQIEYMVFNPWWETPHSIARKDKLPLLQRNPAALIAEGFQVLDGAGRPIDPGAVDWARVPPGTFPYRLRQAPGPRNALGQVKIMFPNLHNVYIHDTPTRGLFAQRQRAFSSGCLRTQDPLDLADWLLQGTPGWSRRRIDEAVASGKETRATLAEPVPVHVLYLTAVLDDGAGIRYLDDLYDRDPALLAGLNTAPN